jgi:hypothetical protein
LASLFVSCNYNPNHFEYDKSDSFAENCNSCQCSYTADIFVPLALFMGRTGMACFDNEGFCIFSIFEWVNFGNNADFIYLHIMHEDRILIIDTYFSAIFCYFL